MIYVAGMVDSPFERMWVLAPRMSKGMGSTPIRISPMNEIAQGDSLGILRGVKLWAGKHQGCASRKDGSRCDTGDCGKVSSKGKIP